MCMLIINIQRLLGSGIINFIITDTYCDHKIQKYSDIPEVTFKKPQIL